MQVGWGWIFASAVAGGLLAVSISAQVLLGSGYERLFYGVAVSLAGAAGVGAVIGAFLALPGAFRHRLLHPSFGLWLMIFFGNVDWLGDLAGPFRWLLQGTLLILVIVGAWRLRKAGPALGVVPGAALAALVAMPISILLWKNAFVPAENRWRFDEPDFGSRIVAEARDLRARTDAGGLPDIWLVVPDQHPSVTEAFRLGVPYSEVGLARLRERGWRIRDNALTDTPDTTVTLAQTLSLSTRLVNGKGQVPATSERLRVLFEQNALRWERSFSDPLLLTVLHEAGYDTWGWFGWWMHAQYLPFLHVDKSRRRALNALHEAALTGWLWIHLGVSQADTTSRTQHFRTPEHNCRELTAQRERFFAWNPQQGADRKPLFVFYHLFWLHDGANMDVSGECQGDEPDDYDLTAEGDGERVAFCKELRERGETVMGWAPGCLPKDVRHKRASKLNLYLTEFLNRLELHANEVAGARPFRILVLADEGMSGVDGGAEYQNPNTWRINFVVKNPAVFRAEFGKGVTRLWPETDVPDMPQAIRDVVVDLVRPRRQTKTSTDLAASP